MTEAATSKKKLHLCGRQFTLLRSRLWETAPQGNNYLLTILPPHFAQPREYLLTFLYVLIQTLIHCNFFAILRRAEFKRPVKLIQQVKIAHSFLKSTSNYFHVNILSLPIFHIWLWKNVSKPTFKN